MAKQDRGHRAPAGHGALTAVRPGRSVLGAPVQTRRLRRRPWKVAELFGLHPSQLAPPASNAEKLKWIEFRGVPDYDDCAVAEQQLSNGRIVLAQAPRDRVADRLEIQNVYGAVFDESTSSEKIRILRRYAANFPYLAFDPDGWLWPLWQQWRSGRSPADRRNLRALAAGIQASGTGWLTKARFHAWQLARAKAALSRLSADPELSEPYRLYLDSQKLLDETDRLKYERHAHKVLGRIRAQTGYRTSIAELQQRKLSGVLRRAVANQYRVRERDLH